MAEEHARALLVQQHEVHPELQYVDAGPEDAAEVEELRVTVRAVIVMHRHFDDPEAGILNLPHHLEADHAGVALEPNAVEDLAPQQPEVAVHITHLKAEQKLDDVV